MVDDRQDALILAADHSETTVEDGRITFSTGVVLGTQPIPKRFVRDLYDIFEKRKPKIPTFTNPQKGREEPNPADPDYLDALKKWELDLIFAVSDFGVMKGTYCIEKPDQVPDVNDEGWVQERAYFGFVVPTAPALRYLAWITYVAAPEDADQTLLSEKVGRLLGITEAAVDVEMQKFRRDETGQADTPTQPEAPSGNGN